MSRVLLTRSQLGRVTHWVRTHHHHHKHHHYDHRFSCSYSTVPFSSTRRSAHPFLLQLNRGKLPPNIVHLTCKSSVKPGFCNAYLIGVNPLYRLSDVLVGTVIKVLKPEVVFLEWCPESQEVLVTNHQKIVGDLKFKPDFLFRKAYEHAMKYGAKVVLGDRPKEITLARAHNKMPFSEKMKLFSIVFREETRTLIKGLVASVKRSSSSTGVLGKLYTMIHIMDVHMVTLLTHKHINICPTYVETLLHERDMYMSSKLLEVAKKSSCVVAVVGNAHLQGIKKHWQQPLKVKDLLTIPPPKSTMSPTLVLTSVGAVTVGAAMIWKYI